MQRRGFAAARAILILIVASGCVAGDLGGDNQVDDSGAVDRSHLALTTIKQYPHKRVCDGTPVPGHARCHARVRINGIGKAVSLAAPSGIGPAQLQAAYKLSGLSGTGTVAIVDAQDDPNAEKDLAVYRSQFGLPPCTTANGCFKKVGQDGSSNLPAPDGGWAEEISLDLDMVSAACPTCKILLVEANSADMNDLGAAVNTAAAMGASAISNSYGGPEDNTISGAESFFNHPGVLITVSSGDSGYGAEYPATSANVLAVGGTSLTQSSSTARGWVEAAWNSGGSGCSAFIGKPSWQKDTGCKNRMEADVSAVGDPNTGVAIYDTYTNTDGVNGWAVFGGTSASSPIVASIFVAANKGNLSPSWVYANPSAFYDVTSGSNGSCGSTKYFCTAGAGYDGPTGWGTPNAAAIAAGSGGGGSSNDFSVALSPTNATIAAGGSVTVKVSTAVVSGSAEKISLSVSGLPSGVSGSFDQTSITAGGGATLTLSANSSAVGGAYTVSAQAASASHTASGSVTVSGGGGGSSNDFSISLSPSTVSVTAGASASFTVSTGVVSGSAEKIALSVSGLPNGVTGSFSQSTITAGASATLTLATTSSAVGGSFTVTGQAASASHTTGGSIAVTSGGGGGGGGTCSHPICSTGSKLKSNCDPCATQICAVDSYCCRNKWDSICVSEVQSVCGESCGGGGGGGSGGGNACTHDVCAQGGSLTSSCSDCAASVCASDSFCCSVEWDSICVSEVPLYCGQSCN